MSYEYIEPMEAGSSALPVRRSPPAPDRAVKARLLLLAKIAFGLTLCAVIVARIDWAEAWSALARTGWGVIAVMFVVLTANVFLSAYKWRRLLLIHGIDYPTIRLSKYYFVALFFNNFLPTSIGGDGYRVYKTFDNGCSKASAVIAVAMERLTGFGTLLALGVGAALLLAANTAAELLLLTIGTGVVCVSAPVVAWRMRSLVPRQLRNAMPEKLRTLRTTLAEHVDDYVRQPGRSLGVIALSIVFHLSLAFAYFVLLRYAGEQPISMLQVMTALALSTVVSVLPISFNGLGVLEGTFIYVLAQYGVPADISIVPMILNRGLLIVLSLVGAGVYLLDAGRFARPASAPFRAVETPSSASK